MYMMESTTADIALVVMLEDDAVEVTRSDGLRLRLSPCGSEFVVERRPPCSGSAPPPSRGARQRTRFATSPYRDFVAQALHFRNMFASRPYLPQEFIPPHRRKRCHADVSEVLWPSASALSSASSFCCADHSPSGEVLVRSVDGNARLLLSSSGEDFYVEFLCRASEDQTQVQGTMSGLEVERRACGHPGSASQHCEEQPVSALGEPPVCAWVAQHHSCAVPPSLWHHPLALALSLRRAKLSGQGLSVGNPSGAGKGCLPLALPLQCHSPHQHRWQFWDMAQWTEEQGGLIGDVLLKVVWSCGVVYRLIRSAVNMVEISPGDGSVIRSSSTVPGYFIHNITGLASQNLEKVYLLCSLPPDRPGQMYSVSSLLAVADRIMKHYGQWKAPLKPPHKPRCWREGRSESLDLTQDSLMPSLGLEQVGETLEHNVSCPSLSEHTWSVSAELEKIRRFNFLLDHNGLMRAAGKCAGSEEAEGSALHHDPILTADEVGQNSIAETLQNTSNAIQDIEALLLSWATRQNLS